jgi:hypothetical protein
MANQISFPFTVFNNELNNCCDKYVNVTIDAEFLEGEIIIKMTRIENIFTGSFGVYNFTIQFLKDSWVLFLENDVLATIVGNCPIGQWQIVEYVTAVSSTGNSCGVAPPTPEDLELINHFRLKVWSKQCKYSKCVMEYVNNLIFGVDVCKLQESLKEQRRVLKILNCYDPRDILNNTTIYNTIPYNKIKKLLD